MLSRGLAILNCFRPGESELALSELARRADLPKPTAHRLIAELVEEGMLERGERGLRLGLGLFALGTRVPRQRVLGDLAQPHLRRMYDLTRQNVFLFCPDGLEPVLVGTALGGPSAGPTVVAPADGEAAACAVTKLLWGAGARQTPGGGWARAGQRPAGRARDGRRLPGRTVREPSPEELARMTEQGFATARRGPETVAVAVPLLDASGVLFAALAVEGAPERTYPVRTAQHLRVAAVALSRTLRGAFGTMRMP